MESLPQEIAYSTNQPVPVPGSLEAKFRDLERIAAIVQMLKDSNLDGVICTLPVHVLLLTGYWPVVGSSIAIATREARIMLIAPADEEDLARNSWVDEIFFYQPGSPWKMNPPLDVIEQRLLDASRTLHLQRGKLGYEGGYESEPSTYAAMHLFGASILKLMQTTFPAAKFIPADKTLSELTSRMTPYELQKLRKTCQIAAQTFDMGRSSVRAGLKETDIAAFFRTPLSTIGTGYEGTARADGFVYCMSGPNAAKAYGAYARSRARVVQAQDMLLIHCNSYADGYWTDISRTYCLGKLDDAKRRMYEAVFTARQRALQSIGPGVRAADIDTIVRGTLQEYGFGAQFKHSTGHGVGFRAFDPNAMPRLHQESPDILQPGMVFNVEPAIYLEGHCGMRHCDMVTVTESGAELLTDFQTEVDELVL